MFREEQLKRNYSVGNKVHMNKTLLILFIVCCLFFVGCHSAGNVNELFDAGVVKQNQSVTNIPATPVPTVKTDKKVNQMPTPTPEYQVKTDEDIPELPYIEHPKLGEHYKPVWIEDEKSDNGFEPFCVQTKIKGKKIERCGYQDADGKVLIKPMFNVAYVFSEGYAGVCPKKDDLCGYINEKGEPVIKANYQFVDVFSEGLAGVKIGDVDYYKYGYINKQNKVVIKLQYTDGEPFKNGVAKVGLRSVRLCINKKDEEVKCPE